MPELQAIVTSLAWPLAIAAAWRAGEFGQRWTGLPRISFYGIAGFFPSTPCCTWPRPLPAAATPTSCATSTDARAAAKAWSTPRSGAFAVKDVVFRQVQ